MRRRWIRAWAVGLATGALGALFALAAPGLGFEERFGLSWLFWARGPLEPPSEVAVVSLDRRSAERLGLPAEIRSWPRTVHAALIDRLVAAGVPVIVFDIAFEKPREPAQDAALAEAIAGAGRVVLFELLDRTRRPVFGSSGELRGEITTEQLRPPFPALAAAAAGLGPFPLPKVPQRVSQFWAFRPGIDGGPTLPAVALQRHALAAHGPWLELLEGVGVDVADLPKDPSRLGDATSLRNLMVTLRAAFGRRPDLAHTLARRLAGVDPDGTQRRLLEALIELYRGPDSRYLRFYGPAGQIPTLPLADVLAEPMSPALRAQLAGRAVFIGQSEVINLHDDGFVTVFSRADGVDLSGVEIAATAFANLLEGRTVRPAGTWQGAVLLAGFGLAIGLIASLLPALVAVPLGLVIGAVYYGASQIAFNQADHWLPLATPLLVQLPLGLFAGLLLQYVEAQRARANVARGLGYYLPERIAAGFAEAPLDPSTLKERLFGACMVTDAERFTRLAEGMTPDELSPFLDRYFAILFGIADRYGGVVTDVVGDGMTCVWTAPQVDADCRRRACLAALDIQREVAAFNRSVAPRRLPTRIGLNAGWVMVGNVGGGRRFAYSVVGDPVNSAARLEGLNKQLGTRILVTEAVIEALPDLCVRPLGRFLLVGKQQPLRLAELLGRQDEGFDPRHLAAFAEALALFEAERWEDAAAAFAALLAAWPDDGPARFYQGYCRHYLAGGPPLPDPSLIRLEHK